MRHSQPLENVCGGRKASKILLQTANQHLICGSGRISLRLDAEAFEIAQWQKKVITPLQHPRYHRSSQCLAVCSLSLAVLTLLTLCPVRQEACTLVQSGAISRVEVPVDFSGVITCLLGTVPLSSTAALVCRGSTFALQPWMLLRGAMFRKNVSPASLTQRSAELALRHAGCRGKTVGTRWCCDLSAW